MRAALAGCAAVAFVLTSRASAQVTPLARQFAPERLIFERARPAVFRVEAGLGRGSGFLVQVPGHSEAFVITNDHVVASDTNATVYLDSLTRVPARIAARDRQADLAILRLPQGRCGACPVLPLAVRKPGEAYTVTGERVLAIGFPLNQGMTLTSGIVSGIRAGAIISDVNVNHGNSGGPLLNMAGDVIGIVTFGDWSSDGGPGISGAIPVEALTPLLDSLPLQVALQPRPPDRILPTWPQVGYPAGALRAETDSLDPAKYLPRFRREIPHFDVSIITPAINLVTLRALEAEVVVDRRQRERRAGVTDAQTYSMVQERRDWDQYVGMFSMPVVSISIVPKISETVGSQFGRALAGGLATAAGVFTTGMQAKYAFQGDVRGVRFYRNGHEIEPIAGGHGPQVASIENVLFRLKDVADRGYYVLSPDAFEPEADGAPAIISMVIQDLKDPKALIQTAIDGEASAAIWNGFKSYYAVVRPKRPWRPANPALMAPAVPMTCEVSTGVCRLIP